MATKPKAKSTKIIVKTTKISRPGVHSKKKNSGLKSSKNWVKPNRGQGK